VSAVVIVNDAFVRRFLPGREPIGAIVGFDRGRGAPVTPARSSAAAPRSASAWPRARRASRIDPAEVLGEI
jgi:hypothetical protein